MSHTQKVRVRGLGQIIHDVLAGIDPTAAMRCAEAVEKRPATDTPLVIEQEPLRMRAGLFAQIKR